MMKNKNRIEKKKNEKINIHAHNFINNNSYENEITNLCVGTAVM